MLAKPQGFPRKLGGCAGLDPRLRSAVSAGVGDGERGLRPGLRAPGVGVRPKWVLEYSPSNKRIRYFVSITYVRTGLWTAHKFCGGGEDSCQDPPAPSRPGKSTAESSASIAHRALVMDFYRPCLPHHPAVVALVSLLEPHPSLSPSCNSLFPTQNSYRPKNHTISIG